MIMNMSRKRSPRKKRFEFCYRPTFEWWSIPYVLVTIVILTESNATSLALQNNTENRENSVRDITKLQHEHKKEMPIINVVFNDTTINFTVLPEHKTHQNNVVSGIINKLVNAERNLVRFPAITTTTPNVIEDKMAASERIIKDKNKHSTDNTASDSIVVLKVNASSVGYVQLSNVTQLNENSINNVEKLQNTTQIVQKQTFPTAAISVPCPYKLLGSNTQNCDNVVMNFNNTSETAKNHKKRLIDDLNSEDYVVNDIEVVKNGVKVGFNYSKDGGINANVAQKNSEVLNMNAHNDVKTSSEGQGNNFNNLVKLSDGQNAKSSIQNSGGRNNSVSDSGDKNNDANNSVRNFENQYNNNDKNIISNNYGRKDFIANSSRLNNSVNNFDTSSEGNKISVYSDFVTSGTNNISFNNFVTNSAGSNKSTNDTFVSSSEIHNSNVNDIVASSAGQNNSVNKFVVSSGGNNISVKDFVTDSGGNNISVNDVVTNTVHNKYVNSSESHNSSADYFETSSDSQNNSVNNSFQNAGSQNNSANNFLNNYSVRGRTKTYLYGGGEDSIKNFANNSGSHNTSVNKFVISSGSDKNSVNNFVTNSNNRNNSNNNFVTSSGNQNHTLNNIVSRSGSHNNSVNNFVTSSGSHNNSVNNFVNSSGSHNSSVNNFLTNSAGNKNSVQSIFTSSGGQNKSAVMKIMRVRTFKGHKNGTHVKAGQGYVLLEDEKDEYEASIDHELDEYDRTTIRAKSPEPEANSGFFGSIQKLTEGVLESLAERIIPKGLRDILKRMQDQNTALETIRLRSKEENGGLGAFGRSLLKGLTDPLTQWVGGTGDRGSLDSDRGFLTGLLLGVADSMGDAFKIKVTAIYPGTLWCGDGHVAEAQSAEVGLFFMTDNCCRRHDSCRLYILAGESDYGLTNTGLFTRSHCSCDSAFYRCLKRTNTLVSSQIGATFFSILGPQCFKRDHPIVKCVRRTRITGQKCEEYEVDKTQPKIWQWFDSPTF